MRDKLERSIRSRITELEVTNRALEKSKIASDNLARQVSSMARKRELLEDRLIKTAERERSQLGLYLHDDLLQQLTGTALFLTSCANRLRGSNKDIAFEIDCSAGYVRDAIKISRNLLHGLLTVDVTTLGIQPLFAELRNALASMYGIKCHVNTSENLSFSDRVARHLYYIAREAAFNAAKHTNATKIEILLLQNCNHIKLEIIDDGSVTKSKDSKQRGYGIEIMKIRARILNASLKIINNKNTGTKLTCSLSGYGVGP